jgi:hypothetical protein
MGCRRGFGLAVGDTESPRVGGQIRIGSVAQGADGDRQLYVVPVSARAPRARADRFAIKGVEPSALLRGVESDCEPVAELSARDGEQRLHVWAVRSSGHLRGTWSRIAPGDWFLFVSRGRIFGVARVFGTCESRATATALWGPTDGSEFRLLVVFDRVQELDVPAWEYRSVLGGRFIGFRRLSDDFRGALVRKFGSVDDFAQRELPRATARAAEEDGDDRATRRAKP